MVPVHTAGEYKLFKTVINSGGFYNETSRAMTAAKVTKTVNFLQFAKAWTEKVHETATEKRRDLKEYIVNCQNNWRSIINCGFDDKVKMQLL